MDLAAAGPAWFYYNPTLRPIPPPSFTITATFDFDPDSDWDPWVEWCSQGPPGEEAAPAEGETESIEGEQEAQSQEQVDEEAGELVQATVREPPPAVRGMEASAHDGHADGGAGLQGAEGGMEELSAEQQMANAMAIYRKALEDAGFTPDEAFQLVRDYHKAMVKAAQGNVVE